MSKEIREGVRQAYSAVAERPESKNVFPVGRRFAESIGYPRDLLDSLPFSASDAFAGVSNVAVFTDIKPGMSVLDLGCGAGLDLLIAAQKTGSNGKIIGIDFSSSMIESARRSIAESGIKNVELYLSDAEKLPVEDSCVDVAMVNGIFNLNHHRDAIFRELSRVVRKGGAVYAAEIILIEPLPADFVCDINKWFE